MFSFEGEYKTKRPINYNNERDVRKKDLIENAKFEREKRALLSRQIVSASVIQSAYRQYTNRMIKRKWAFTDYHSMINELKNSYQTTIDDNFLNLVFRIMDKLLIFFNGSNTSDQSLNLLIEMLIKGDCVRFIIDNQPIHNYYNAVTLSLLLRVTSRYLRCIEENSSPVIYNLFLRFFELLFISLDTCCSRAAHLQLFHKHLLLLLTDSSYFSHMSLFVCRQLIKQDSVDDCYKETKVNYVLKVILSPIEQSKKLNMLSPLIISYFNSIYSVSDTNHQEHILRQFKLMSIALLDIVEWEIIVDIIFSNYIVTGHGYHISTSVGLIYFLLTIKPIVAEGLSQSSNVKKAAAQILILFFKLSHALFTSKRLFLSNNITNVTLDNSYVATRDDFDFDMKETQSWYSSPDNSSDDEDEEKPPCATAPLIATKEMSPIEQEIALALKHKFAHEIVPWALLNEDPSLDETTLTNAIGYVYNLLVLQTKLIGTRESKTFILKLIQTNKNLFQRLWRCTVDQKSKDLNKSVMDAFIKWDIKVTDSELDLFFGKLLCFANCLHWRLLSVQDLDLISLSSDRSSEVLEFSSEELCTVVLKLRDIMCGLIFLIYPSTSQLPKNAKSPSSPMFTEKLTKIFIELQRVVVRLYNRDVRKGLKMSGKRLEWVLPDMCRVNVNNLKNFRHLLLEDYRFGQLVSNQLISVDLRQFVILKEMPFIVPIGTRMKIFKHIITSMAIERTHNNRTLARIRRDHIYEDAFTQITKKNVPNLRSHLQIEFVDRFGIDEAGIDGGGLFREFLSAIVVESCDPKRGLFVTTTNNLLYPNPEIETLYPDNWKSHLFFIGRMIGLIVFKGLLVEVPFAPFFLQKLFSNKSSTEEIDIDNLQYLDEELYRHLLSLKSLDLIDDISLDFTVARQCYGVSKMVELKPNGANIAVNNDNKIEYIYLVADYKLNRQIAAETAVIIAGINDVVSIECFQLFDLDEISLIITGGGAPIDLDDLRHNTVYHGLDDPDQSDTINFFWRVLNEMTEEEKRSFIQFVTSLSRAPMLGFGELIPKFAIVLVPDTDRLPTASTCLNLLKLPAYTDLEEMRLRILYAIGSDTGFHLS